MGQLAEEAIKRVSGPAWQPLRETFIQLSGTLLSVSPDAYGVLTTIYVKYQVDRSPNAPVYAVAWLKTSKEIVVGLALPEEFQCDNLGPAPSGMKYKGINKYFK